MEISYWQSRWKKGNTGWHMQQVYPHLITYWHKLNLDRGSSVLVPLCGKSLDMQWLADRGYRVTGVEVSEVAIKEFINESPLSFAREDRGPFTIYSGGSIRLWQGDVFRFKPSLFPSPDAVYDKAALIALPPEKQRRYAALLKSLCGDHTQILLNSMEYPQEEMTGPPFSVTEQEISNLYGQDFEIRLLHESSLLPEVPKFRQRGLASYLMEKVYHLLPRRNLKPEAPARV